MLGRGAKNAPIDKLETVIGPNTNFSGKLLCDGSVRIDGICEEGVIESVGNIVVGPQAKVAADLIAENVSVSGAVTGNITVTGRLEILSTGKMWGDANVGSFLLDEEGFFRGNLIMKDEPEPPTFTAPPDEAPIEPTIDTAGETTSDQNPAEGITENQPWTLSKTQPDSTP